MYKLTPYGQTRKGLRGVPWRDLSDEEYAAAVARHPGMQDHGYFEQAPEPPSIEETPLTRGRRSAEED